MLNVSSITTTRNELLKRKKQIELTRAGYDLLDKKRLALMQALIRLQDEVVQKATNLESLTVNATQSLARAEALIGDFGVRSAAMGEKHDIELEVTDRLLMGVHVPSIQLESAKIRLAETDISMTDTSFVVDEAAKAYEIDIEGIINLADTEIQLSKLIKEIIRTTRRLNALEHIVLPGLKAEYKHISNALEERERSEHYTVKLAKKLIQKRKI